MVKNIESLKKLSWEDFYNTPLNKKINYFADNNRLFDCLFSQQFNRKLLDQLFTLATKIRMIAKNKDNVKIIKFVFIFL